MEKEQTLQSILNHKPSEIVPVIASFDKSGKISPLYVRIGSDAYKINSSWRPGPCYTNTMYFNCHIIDHGYLKPISLTFHRKENMWSMDI